MKASWCTWLPASGMVHELDVGAGAAAREHHRQGVEDQVGPHVRRELPADDLARPDIDHEGEEHHAVPAAQRAEVGNHSRSGPAALMSRFTRPGGRTAVGPGSSSATACRDARRPECREQRIRRLIRSRATATPSPSQRQPRAPIAIAVVVGGMDTLDLTEQPLILDGPAGSLAGLALRRSVAKNSDASRSPSDPACLTARPRSRGRSLPGSAPEGAGPGKTHASERSGEICTSIDILKYVDTTDARACDF